jgi:hypothetical protein
MQVLTHSYPLEQGLSRTPFPSQKAASFPSQKAYDAVSLCRAVESDVLKQPRRSLLSSPRTLRRKKKEQKRSLLRMIRGRRQVQLFGRGPLLWSLSLTWLWVDGLARVKLPRAISGESFHPCL